MAEATEELDSVARTSLLAAAMRAVETEREDQKTRLCDDPFARALAGPEGLALLEDMERSVGDLSAIIATRTRFVDQHMAEALATGIRQVVLIAAGMDSRAFRMTLPAGVRLFELDRPAVLAYKEVRLRRAPLGCERIPVPVDLRADWSAALLDAGFYRSAKTLWVVEGVLQYLDRPAVGAILAGVDALAPPGSVILFDIVGRIIIEAPWMAPLHKFLAGIDAPWIFGHDDPRGLMEELGLSWTLSFAGPNEVGAPLGRSALPPSPPAAADAPGGFYIAGRKP